MGGIARRGLVLGFVGLVLGCDGEDQGQASLDLERALFALDAGTDAADVTPHLEPGQACSLAGECLSGFCVDGVCCDTACGGGQEPDCLACSVAAGAAQDGVCSVLAADAVCRPETGGCDLPETCDGLAPECPADLVVGAGTVCAPADGVCDLADTCDGVSGVCTD